MPLSDRLFWTKLTQPVFASFRALSDGANTLAVLDLHQRRGPPESKSDPPGWVYSHQPHGFVTSAGEGSLRYPVLGLTDGRGGMPVVLMLVDREAWNDRLRGTTLPVFMEEGRKIDFPQLPNEILKGNHW